jgi:hypothetical protein
MSHDGSFRVSTPAQQALDVLKIGENSVFKMSSHHQGQYSQSPPAFSEHVTKRLWHALVTELDQFEKRRANSLDASPPCHNSGDEKQDESALKARYRAAHDGRYAAQTLLMLAQTAKDLHGLSVPGLSILAPDPTEDFAQAAADAPPLKLTSDLSFKASDNDTTRDIDSFRQELAQCLDRLRSQRHAQAVAEDAQAQ